MRNTPRRKPDYLWVRSNTDVVWFSRAVPKRLWGDEGRKVIQFPLGTTDRREAEALARRHASDLDERWGMLPASTPERRVPTGPELEALAVEIGHDAVMDHTDRRRQEPGGWHRHINRTRRALDDHTRFAVTGDYQVARGHAALALEDRGFDLPPESEAYAKFVADLSAAMLAAARTGHERALGNIEADTESKLVRRVREREKDKAKPGEKITELFERWAADRLAKGEKRADTVNQDRKVIEQFAAFVGEDRAIGSITAIEIAEYRDILRQLPPKWKANKALAGLDMRAAAAKARKEGMPESAFTSINKVLSTISPLYRWLAAQPAWAGLANPVTGLFHDKVKGKRRRPSFSTDHLNKILRSPLFSGFLADRREHRPGNMHADDWRKWIPLICLFTGARIGEIAQLRVGDVRQERGVWFIHISHDETAGLMTKSGKSRPAAVHPMLAKIGFLGFHERQLERAGGDLSAPLFPELEPNARGQISGTPSRWWREYLEAIGVKDGADGFGAHSFRHTLADRLRSEVELLDPQVAIALGHAQPSTTAGYGELSQGTVNMLSGWMEALRFDGVEFAHLIEAE